MTFLHEIPEAQSGISWEQMRGVLRRRWKLMVLAFVATILASYGTLQLLTDKYESSASLMVKVGRENAEMPATVQNGGLMPAGVKKEEINSEISMLTSRALIEKAVEEIGVERFLVQPPRPVSVFLWPKYYAKQTARWVREQAANTLVVLNLKKKLTNYETVVTSLESSLDVEAEKNSNIIGIHLQLADPQLGQQVLEQVVAAYLNQHTAVYQNPAVKDFFDQALRENLERLRALEDERDRIRGRRRLSAVAEQQALLLKQQSEISGQLHSDQAERALLATQLAAMQQKANQQPEQVLAQKVQTENPSIQSIRDRLTTLLVEHARLSSRYLPESGPVVKNEEEIAELQRELAKEPATIEGKVTAEANPLRRNLLQGMTESEVRIAGLEAKDQQLKVPAEAIAQRLRVLDKGQDELDNVQREIKTVELNYEVYAKHLEEARISDELDKRRIANIALLSPPSTAYEPVYPKKTLIMRLSLALGLLLAVLLALGAEYLDDTIHSERDLKIEELNYLGSMRVAA